MSKRLLLLFLSAASVAAIIAYLSLSGPGESVGDDDDHDEASRAESGHTTAALGEARSSTSESGGTEARAAGRRRAVSNEERELARALHQAVRTARARSEGATAGGSASGTTRAATGTTAGAAEETEYGTLDPEFIRDAVREVVPLLQECYEMALEEQPGLAGTLVLEFTIEGEPDVGGVVEDPTIADISTLTHPSLDECVRETMYTLRLPAPEGSGSVTVRYPFRFSEGDAQENEGAAGGRAEGRAP